MATIIFLLDLSLWTGSFILVHPFYNDPLLLTDPLTAVTDPAGFTASLQCLPLSGYPVQSAG